MITPEELLLEGNYESRVGKIVDADGGWCKWYTPLPDGTEQVNIKVYIEAKGWKEGQNVISTYTIRGDVLFDIGTELAEHKEYAIYVWSDGSKKDRRALDNFIHKFYEDHFKVDLSEILDMEIEKDVVYKITAYTPIEEADILFNINNQIQKEFGESKVYSEVTLKPDEDVVDIFRLVKDGVVAVNETNIGEGYYRVPEHIITVEPVIHNMLKNRHHVNLLAVGESGTGKTTAAEYFAQSFDLFYSLFPVSSVVESTDWYFTRVVKNGKTISEPTNFLLALLRGNTVLLLDEINRIPSALANPLFNILDGTRWVSLNQPDLSESDILTPEEKEKVMSPDGFEVASNILFYATANIGNEYSGVYPIDTALYNRFDITEMFVSMPLREQVTICSNRTGVEISVAEDIVSIVDEISEVANENYISGDFTIRTKIKIAHLFANGMDIRGALIRVVVNPIVTQYKDSAKVILDVVDKYFPQNMEF